MNIIDSEVKRELQQVFDDRTEENVLWGPGFILPQSVLKQVQQAFGITPRPLAEMGWKAGLEKQSAAFRDPSMSVILAGKILEMIQVWKVTSSRIGQFKKRELKGAKSAFKQGTRRARARNSGARIRAPEGAKSASG